MRFLDIIPHFLSTGLGWLQQVSPFWFGAEPSVMLVVSGGWQWLVAAGDTVILQACPALKSINVTWPIEPGAAQAKGLSEMLKQLHPLKSFCYTQEVNALPVDTYS